ncbi:hypothetical protein JXA88_08215 [Candidatus Fermentibacteria bacterium]|nr:hypothetical protein [Candidatus Fermentibacteria bacterium]
MVCARLPTYLLGVLCAVLPAGAQIVSWDVIAAGGTHTSASECHGMASTVGQALAGMQVGPTHWVWAGFWNPAVRGPLGTGNAASLLPTSFRLGTNCPNPFTDRTTVFYAIPMQCRITLQIYDLQGRLIRHVVDAQTSAGFHACPWDGRDFLGRTLGSGAYVARLNARSLDHELCALNHTMILVR